MDEERRIRFLVSPALFIASLFIGAWSDPMAHDWIERIIEKSEWSKLVELAAAGGAVVFAGGYVFGTISYFFLRLVFLCRPRHWGRFHEVAFSDKSFGQVWDLIGAPGELDRSQELSAGAVFDFDVLRNRYKGVHQWLFRRWSAFNIAASSITALALSFPAGNFIGIPWSLAWFLSVGIFIVFLWFVMFWAWRDTMRMARFMASIEAKKAEEL